MTYVVVVSHGTAAAAAQHFSNTATAAHSARRVPSFFVDVALHQLTQQRERRRSKLSSPFTKISRRITVAKLLQVQHRQEQKHHDIKGRCVTRRESLPRHLTMLKCFSRRCQLFAKSRYNRPECTIRSDYTYA